jgi:hypothetical protein
MLSACLEGQTDRDVHGSLSGEIEAAMLHDCKTILERRFLNLQEKFTNNRWRLADDDMSEITVMLSECEKRLSLFLKGRINAEGEAETLPMELFRAKDEVKVLLDGLVDVRTIQQELLVVPSFAEQMKPYAQDGTHSHPQNEKERDLHIDHVEIAWGGTIERVYFSAPRFTQHLNDETKAKFLENCDLATTERRNKELLGAVDTLMDQMKNVEFFASRFKFYRFVQTYFDYIKLSNYLIIVLLNMNVLFSSEELAAPYPLLTDCPSSERLANGYCEIPDDLFPSFLLTCALGGMNFSIYFIIIGFVGLTEVPFVITQTEKAVKEFTTERTLDSTDIKFPFKPYLNWWALRPSAMMLGFVVVFMIIHSANFESSSTIYGFMAFFTSLFFAISLRQLVVVPWTWYLKLYTIIFDLTLSKPFLRNCVTLQVFCGLGFYDNKWFSVMLFDIFNNSRVLQDVLRAITQPAAKLFMVLYTMAITVIVFAMFGVRTFGTEEFHHREDESSCDSTLACFAYIFYAAVPAGDISGIMKHISPSEDGDLFWGRMLYDLVFFVWMVVLLFNIVAGLMLDTFSALREEENKRYDILTNSCFICGIRRSEYINQGLPSSAPSFDQHIEEEHNIWSYVNFVAKLKSKDPRNYNGREAYVWSKCSVNSLDWLPNKTSLYIEQAHEQRAINSEEEDGDTSANDSSDDED